MTYCQECGFTLEDSDPVEFGAENFDECPDCGGEFITEFDVKNSPDFEDLEEP